MTCSPIDHKAYAYDNLLTQYKFATNFIAYLNVFLEECNDIETVFCQLLDERSLDTAIGAQLDVLGIIVGQSRTIPAYDSLDYFGFKGAIGAGGFADDGVGGSPFWTEGLPLFQAGSLSDDQLRTYIKAKIKKNHTKIISTEEVIEVLSEMFPAITITISKTQAKVVNIDFDAALTDAEKLSIVEGNIVPIPSGCRYSFSDNNGLFL